MKLLGLLPPGSFSVSPLPLPLSVLITGVESGMRESGIQLPLIYHDQPLNIPGHSSTLHQSIVKMTTVSLAPDKPVPFC